MGMRLMTKKEVGTATNALKKSEMDEGKKLAKQIISIRRTKAEEEVSLEKFRSETIKNIKSELEPLQIELEKTKKELQDAKATRDELLEPLDEERKEIEKIKAEVERTREQAIIELELACKDKKEAKAVLLQSERIEASAVTREEVAHEARNSAILLEREVDELREKAIKTNREADEYKHRVSADMDEELSNLKIREKALVENEKKVISDRMANEILERQLEDERQTLERSFNRLKT